MSKSEKDKDSKLSVELYHESCFEYIKKVKTNSVDLVLIDPPYGISRESGYTNNSPDKVEYIKKYGKHKIDFGEWDNDFDGLKEVITESYRVLRKGGTFICFYDIWKITELKEYIEEAKFKQLRYIEWIKTNPVPRNSKVNYLTNAREIALTGTKVGKPTFNSSYDNGIYEYPLNQEKGRFHPTQKPLPLIETLILKHSNVGDIVLDCFSGSGTTAVAAIRNNRSFQGCEISEEYHKKSISRVDKEIKELEKEIKLVK